MAEPHQIPWDLIDLQHLKLWPLLCLKSETGFHWTQKNTLWDSLKPVLCASEELNDSQDFLWAMYKHTLCTECKQASPDTQTQNTLPGMCQGEEEISKSLHFYWELHASPPTSSAVCTPRNQHCLNLWYFNKPSCQAKDALRHITFVQRRIPAAAKSRERELCYRPTHRYVKRVLLKITALRTAWSGRGTGCLESAHESDRLQQKILSLYTEENETVQIWMPFFCFIGTGWQKQIIGIGLHRKEEFSFFSGITIHLHYSVTQASLETECHWVMAVID